MKYLVAIFFALTSYAALPPFAQSSREIQAILANSKTHEALGSAEQILEIRKIDTGYLLTTKNYELQVDVRYGGGKQIAGPVHFELEFHPPFDFRIGQVKRD